MRKIARSAIVACSPEQFYALVEDIESYPSFLPGCVAAEVHERSGDETEATLTLGMAGLRQSFTTRNENTPGRAIDLRLVTGPFRRFAASWRFTPLGKQGTKVEFSMEYEFSSRILGRVLQPAFDRMADSMVDAFTRRAEDLHGDAEG